MPAQVAIEFALAQHMGADDMARFIADAYLKVPHGPATKALCGPCVLLCVSHALTMHLRILEYILMGQENCMLAGAP